MMTALELTVIKEVTHVMRPLWSYAIPHYNELRFNSTGGLKNNIGNRNAFRPVGIQYVCRLAASILLSKTCILTDPTYVQKRYQELENSCWK